MASEYISNFSVCTHMCTSKTVLFTKNLLHFKISLQTKRYKLHLYLLNCFYIHNSSCRSNPKLAMLLENFPGTIWLRETQTR